MHKVKIIAILNKYSPVNVILSRRACKIKMMTNLNHSVVYETSNLASTKSIRAYLTLPLWLVKLVLTAPAVVLKNEICDLQMRPDSS